MEKTEKNIKQGITILPSLFGKSCQIIYSNKTLQMMQLLNATFEADFEPFHLKLDTITEFCILFLVMISVQWQIEIKSNVSKDRLQIDGRPSCHQRGVLLCETEVGCG